MTSTIITLLKPFLKHVLLKHYKVRKRFQPWSVFSAYLSGKDTLTQKGFPGDSAVKIPPATQETHPDAGSIPGSRRPPGGGHGTPLQGSGLEDPLDRGA